MDCWSSTWSL